MSDPTLVVRVAANLAELKANLAEGLPQIETYRAALARASTAYDGSRVVQQASAAAAAIQNAGGVTALTASESARANAIFTDAAQKLELMGKGGSYVAQQFREMAEATKREGEELGGEFLSALKEVGGVLGVAFSAERAVEFLKSVAEEAHQLEILSLQTRINVEDLQLLKVATKEYGVEGDELARALYQLSRRIAGGDASVATAYHLMGMTLDEVRGKDALDLFLTTERGLGKLQGAVQDTAAADLYGGRLGISMIAFSKGVDEAMDKARQLNAVASKESV